MAAGAPVHDSLESIAGAHSDRKHHIPTLRERGCPNVKGTQPYQLPEGVLEQAPAESQPRVMLPHDNALSQLQHLGHI